MWGDKFLPILLAVLVFYLLELLLPKAVFKNVIFLPPCQSEVMQSILPPSDLFLTLV